MKHFFFFALVFVSVLPVRAFLGLDNTSEKIAATRAEFPDLKFEISLPRTQFELGEAIPVQMKYAYSGTRPLRVWQIGYDRSGRIMEFGFRAQNEAGKAVRDPFPFVGGIGGGLRTIKALTNYEQTATLNEWVAFDAPGHYKIWAWSEIVAERKDGNDGARVIPLESAPIEVEILPPDPEKSAQRLESARVAVKKALDLAAILPKGGESYQRSEKIDALARKSVRDLRWMIDERAIDILLPALELGGGAAFEAHRGLAAFPDLMPVKAAILRRLEEPKPVVEGHWEMENLLARAEGEKSEFWMPETDAAKKRAELFNRPLRSAIQRAERDKQPTEAAALSLELLLHSPTARHEAATWRRVLENLTVLSKEEQFRVSSILRWETEPKETLFPLDRDQLRHWAWNGALEKEVRSQAVLALARRAGFSVRSLLAQDVTALEPKFNGAALATLGDFKARERATKLLKLFATSALESEARLSLAKRLRDLGSGATLEELIAAARQMMALDPADATLLEAVALRSPSAAVPLVKRALELRGTAYGMDLRLNLLLRLDDRAARDLLREYWQRPQEGFLRALLSETRAVSERARYKIPRGEPGELFVPAKANLTAFWLPEIESIWEKTPSGPLRRAALEAVREITDLPRDNLSEASPEKTAAWRQQWTHWWLQNRVRLGRPEIELDARNAR